LICQVYNRPNDYPCKEHGAEFLRTNDENTQSLCSDNEPIISGRLDAPRPMDTCWLIEANGKYWSAEGGMCIWTPDPWKAVRFSRKEDAERTRMTATGSDISVAVQHSFETGRLDAPAGRFGDLEVQARIVEIVDHLVWALDIMGRYEGRLIQFGDPKELVYSEVHKNRLADARGAVEGAWQMLWESSECNHCKSGNVPLSGWHNFINNEIEPCTNRALASPRPASQQEEGIYIDHDD
jgi:hypothetical protein